MNVGIIWFSVLVIVFIVSLWFARRSVSNKARGGNTPWDKEEQ